MQKQYSIALHPLPPKGCIVKLLGLKYEVISADYQSGELHLQIIDVEDTIGKPEIVKLTSTSFMVDVKLPNDSEEK